ncbi:MAG: HAMP domain-containing histidine kinase [Caulobacter sp.]|nr:HAMP domain-containing histidine kinase [Caulobacter sp.]
MPRDHSLAYDAGADPRIDLIAVLSKRMIGEITAAVAMLRLAAADEPTDAARQALNDAADHLRDQARLQHALEAPEGGQTVDLSDNLEALCAALSHAKLQRDGIHLGLVCDPVAIDARRCWLLSLIVAELVDSAASHAPWGEGRQIAIRVGVADGEVCCEMGRVGRGWGCGLSRVINLVSLLHGRIEWSMGPHGEGARLTFPADCDPVPTTRH